MLKCPQRELKQNFNKEIKLQYAVELADIICSFNEELLKKQSSNN